MKKLIIAPHIDDEVLGCSSVLDNNAFVYYCGIDEGKLPPDPTHRIPVSDRLKEVEAVSKFLGFEYRINNESKVNFYIEQDFIGILEGLINELKPDAIFLPHFGYNQDHKTIFNAAQVALRPHDKNFFVKKVLVYEAIHDFIWSYNKIEINHFVPLDVEKKIKANSLHGSQVRGMRSPEMLKCLAQLRGSMCGSDFAEAFQALRWVDNV